MLMPPKVVSERRVRFSRHSRCSLLSRARRGGSLMLASHHPRDPPLPWHRRREQTLASPACTTRSSTLYKETRQWLNHDADGMTSLHVAHQNSPRPRCRQRRARSFRPLQGASDSPEVNTREESERERRTPDKPAVGSGATNAFERRSAVGPAIARCCCHTPNCCVWVPP